MNIFSEVTNEDNMEMMSRYPDKFFDLAIVDPPYGLPKDSLNGRGKMKSRALNIGRKDWDIAPQQYYFDELFRVSKNQIIWGANYFSLPPTREMICWDKVQPFENFSAFELAWTSFNGTSRFFKFDNRTGDKIHPTQKPIALYEYCLKRYAQKGDKILDTHLGSGSSRIAAYKLGFDFWGCEIDKPYFDAANERFIQETAAFGIDSEFF